MGKRIWRGILSVALMAAVACAVVPGGSAQAANGLLDTGDELVIVIDPGHGGENEGTKGGVVLEKEMTLVTAKAMYRALSEYDGVTVYLTRSSDAEMSLADRAAFAESVGADFLFSIHYNASENQTMFGSEVWISCKAPYNAYGYQFAYNHLQNIRKEIDGIYIRGVKSRVNDDGEDYYGVIRESAALEIPALIIEHCYVDEERDADYADSEEDWERFGEIDALSVAQYFGLKSTSLGVDYSSYPETELPLVNADAIVPGTIQDTTSPDVCTAELLNADYATGQIEIRVTAADYDSFLSYYSVSMDGGETWSRWESWPDTDALEGTYTDTITLELTADGGTRPEIIVRAYNKADLYKDSAALALGQFDEATENADRTAEQENGETPATEGVTHEKNSIGTTTFLPVGSEAVEDGTEPTLFSFLKICFVVALILMLMILTTQFIVYRRRKRRRQRLRELEREQRKGV